MKLYLFAFLFIFFFFGSLYGLFVNELNIGFGAGSRFNYVLSGWAKNVICVIGLLLIGVVSAYPVVSIVYKALETGGKQ